MEKKRIRNQLRGNEKMGSFVQKELSQVLEAIQRAADKYDLDAKEIKERVALLNGAEEEANEQILFYALNNISMDQPNWTFVAAQAYLNELYEHAAKNRGYDPSQKYGDFYGLMKTLTEKGIYSRDLLASYSKQEVEELETEMNPDRDHLFNYIGLFLLADRYLARDHDRNMYELPQERFMIIAMHLMKNEERSKRLELVKEAYWALSQFVHDCGDTDTSKCRKKLWSTLLLFY